MKKIKDRLNDIGSLVITKWFLEENISVRELCRRLSCSYESNSNMKIIKDFLDSNKINYFKKSGMDVGQKELEEVVLKSSSFLEVIRTLGYQDHGGNRKTLKKILKKYNITDFSHFLTGADSLKLRNKRVTLNCEQILCKDSTAYRGTLCKYIRKEKLLEEKCIECGLGNIWNGKAIVLQLDHINGINNDNRLENLRFLCPNCHTQTNTFGRKKRV